MLLRVFSLLIGPFLALAKMAIFAVLFIVAVLVSVITTPLVPYFVMHTCSHTDPLTTSKGYIPFLGRLIQRFLEFVVRARCEDLSLTPSAGRESNAPRAWRMLD